MKRDVSEPGRDSSVSIVTELRAGRSGDRIPEVGAARFSADRPLNAPSLLYDWYRVCFQAVKRPGRGTDHPPRSGVEIKEMRDIHGLFRGEPYVTGSFWPKSIFAVWFPYVLGRM